MPAMQDTTPTFKIDRFRLPARNRDAFLSRTKWIRNFLIGLDGCRRVILLEGESEGDIAAIATISEWRDGAAMAAARRIADAHYQAAGFDPKAFMAELGVEFKMDSFTQLPA